MNTLALVIILFAALFLIAVLFSISIVSPKTKERTMYVGSTLSLFLAILIWDYANGLPDADTRASYMWVLLLDILIGNFCIVIAFMVKFNVLKQKSKALEVALTDKNQEKVTLLMEQQHEKQQVLQKSELEWLASKIKTFSEEEQKAILSCAYTFVENDLVISPNIEIAKSEECSQSDIMYICYSAFYTMGKKREQIIDFIYNTFTSYFPASRSGLSKKMPGVDKVMERRMKEDMLNRF